MRCLMVVQDAGWAVLCSLPNKTQDMNQNYHLSQVERRHRRNSSIYIPCSSLHLLSLFLPYYRAHRKRPELSRHHVIWTKQRLPFQRTPDNLYNFVLSLRDSFRYMQLYHNANSSDVDIFSTNSDGTTGQPQTKGEG